MPVLSANIEHLRKIVQEQQAYKLRWATKPKATIALVDGITANAVIAAYDAASDETKAKMEGYIRKGPQSLVKIASLVMSKMVVALMIVGLVSGCAATRYERLSADIKTVCGLPLPDLSNVDAYQTCVLTVLDTHAEANGGVLPPMEDE